MPRLLVVRTGEVDGQQGDEGKRVTLTGHKGLAAMPLDGWSDKPGDVDSRAREFKDCARWVDG